MKDWMIQVLTSKDFWINFSVTVIFLLLAKLSALVIRLARQIRQSRQLYSVSGFWIGACVLPGHGEGYLVEIWRFIQRQDQIKLNLFVYSPNDRSIDRCIGSGVFRGSYLSAIYYSWRRDSYESGALALELHNQRLRGKYAQYDVRDPEEKFYVGEFRITRVHLERIQAVKMLLGRAPFKDYDEANKVYIKMQCAKEAPTAKNA